MLKSISGSGISRDHIVKTRPHPGATTIDMIDYRKLELHNKAGIIILHCGSNDITNDMNIVKEMKKWAKEIEGYNSSTDMVISLLIKQFHCNVTDDIKKIN